MDHSLSTFLSGCARYHDFVFFAKSLDELGDRANSTFLFIDGATTARFGEPSGFPAIAMAVVKVEERLVVCALGPNGELWEGMPADGSSVTGAIGIGEHAWRSLALVEGEIFACGMNRAVAMRTGPTKWRDLSAPEPGKGDDRIVGFEGIDGFSATDLYAVGWNGEVWQRKGEAWRQAESGVSANLNAVCCAESGVVYAVGDGGVMIEGRDDVWKAIDTGVSANLHDVRDWGGTVYVSTDFELLALENGKLEPVFADGADAPSTCLRLAKAADGLVSIGPKDLFKLHAGTWQRVV